MAHMFLDGNEAIAMAALDTGCRFFAGYPITPATSIFNHMMQLLPPEGGICLQGEDEISSIGFCLGASMAGTKAMTATSGPGISLVSEQISFAIGGEIPLVIIDVQRLGPSTGSATKGADGDIQFLRWGNSGGLPLIVLAPVDVVDCYLLTIHAFNLAEQYRCPVCIASNKEVGLTKESVDLEQIEMPDIIERTICDADSDVLPFQTAPGDMVPAFPAIGGQIISRQTSSTHGEDGYITTDPEKIGATIQRLKEKLQSAGDTLTHFEFDNRDGDIWILVSYGITSRAARAAIGQLRGVGCKVSLLVLKTLYPVPEEVIRNAISGKERIIVVEMNCGQYVREIERLSGSTKVEFYGLMNGELISPQMITERILP